MSIKMKLIKYVAAFNIWNEPHNLFNPVEIIRAVDLIKEIQDMKIIPYNVSNKYEVGVNSACDRIIGLLKNERKN